MLNESPLPLGEIIVYEIVYEVNNHLFVRFLKGNALAVDSEDECDCNNKFPFR